VLRSDDFLVQELLTKGLVSSEDVALASREAADGDVAARLVERGSVSSRDVALTRAVVCETPFVDLDKYEIALENASLLPRGVCESRRAFPLFAFEGGVVVGMEDPLDFRGLDQIRRTLNVEAEAVLCEPGALEELIGRAYRLLEQEGAPAAGEADAGEGDGSGVDADDPVVATVNDVIASAIRLGASDIHLGPDESCVHLRYRVDGVLQPRRAPALAMHRAMVRRLKVMARLDLTQTRKPLDGKIAFRHRGETVDLRLSVIPTVWGENVVIRVLRRGEEIKDYASLGVPAVVRESLEGLTSRPHGMLLVTGPTGSGKTTTLYTALSGLNTPERNVMTIEDPVEVRLPMVRQTQVNTETGLTFATALRSILRQDPDVVLVGEIRDRETAQIAVQAALTGHLVLSTLHTNDAPGAAARLRDFDVPPFAISAALLGVVAQRLVRRVCESCAGPAEHDASELRLFRVPPDRAWSLRQGAGCPACGGTGYRGRVGVCELMRATPRVRALIAKDGDPAALASAARADGLRPMWMDCVDKALEGVTTLSEAARVRADDEAGAVSPGGGGVKGAAA